MPCSGERHWPKKDFPLNPQPVKVGPGRPKKNRRKDPSEHPKKPGKLTRHCTKMTCNVCKSKDHNKRTCGRDQAPATEPQTKRPRGRPRKSDTTSRTDATRGSTTTGRTDATRGRGRGRVRRGRTGHGNVRSNVSSGTYFYLIFLVNFYF